jgi:hypothetical protein
MKYDLVEKFDRKWSEFKAIYGSTAAESQTTLAFHGTLTPEGLHCWLVWAAHLGFVHCMLQARAAI